MATADPVDDAHEHPSATCPTCRSRPRSRRVSPAELPRLLPRGWQALGTAPPLVPRAADLPRCSECGTCGLLWHDAGTGLLEATFPLPAAATPLLNERKDVR